MSPATVAKSSVADWVKWAIGFSYAVIIGIGGYVVTVEHRQTKTEEGLTTQKDKLNDHITSAQKEKEAINARLDEQAKDQKQVLTTMTAVAVDVAEIKGYLKHGK